MFKNSDIFIEPPQYIFAHITKSIFPAGIAIFNRKCRYALIIYLPVNLTYLTEFKTKDTPLFLKAKYFL